MCKHQWHFYEDSRNGTGCLLPPAPKQNGVLKFLFHCAFFRVPFAQLMRPSGFPLFSPIGLTVCSNEICMQSVPLFAFCALLTHPLLFFSCVSRFLLRPVEDIFFSSVQRWMQSAFLVLPVFVWVFPGRLDLQTLVSPASKTWGSRGLGQSSALEKLLLEQVSVSYFQSLHAYETFSSTSFFHHEQGYTYTAILIIFTQM